MRTIGTHGSLSPSRGFTERLFETPEEVHAYHQGHETGMMLHGNMTDKRQLKDLKSEHNKKLFRMSGEPQLEQARERGYIDALHHIAGSTPADLENIEKPNVEPDKPSGGETWVEPGHFRAHVTPNLSSERRQQIVQHALGLEDGQLVAAAANAHWEWDDAQATYPEQDVYHGEPGKYADALNIYSAELKHRGLPDIHHLKSFYEANPTYRLAYAQELHDRATYNSRLLNQVYQKHEPRARDASLPSRDSILSRAAMDASQEIGRRRSTMPEPDYLYDDPADQQEFDEAYKHAYLEHYDKSYSTLAYHRTNLSLSAPADKLGRQFAVENLMRQKGSPADHNPNWANEYWRTAYAEYLQTFETLDKNGLDQEARIMDSGRTEPAIHELAAKAALQEARLRHERNPIHVPARPPSAIGGEKAAMTAEMEKEDFGRGYRKAFVEHRRSDDTTLKQAHEATLAKSMDSSVVGKQHAEVEGRLAAIKHFMDQRGLSGEPAPHYSDDPIQQASFEKAYRLIKHQKKGLSKLELDNVIRSARNGSIDGIGYHSLAGDERKAAQEGVIKAVEELRPNAPEFPAAPDLPEFARPGGKYHDDFLNQKREAIRVRAHLDAPDLIRDRYYALGEWGRGKAAHHEGVINQAHGTIAGIDFLLRNPIKPRSIFPDPVKKLTPKQIAAQFPKDRYGFENLNTNQDLYRKEYRRMLKDMEDTIGSRSGVEKIRFRAEVDAEYSTGVEDKLKALATLAAADTRLAEMPVFGPKIVPAQHVLATIASARAQADEVYDINEKSLLSDVQKAVQEAKTLDSYTGILVKHTPVIPEGEMDGTSPGAESLAADLRLLLHYDEIPFRFKDGQSYYGMYSPFSYVSTNSIKTGSIYIDGAPKRDAQGGIVSEPKMNQHAKVLAHEVGHHYAWMMGRKLETFTNSSQPNRPNRDEIVAEAVANNLTRIYDVPNTRANGYIFRMADSDPALKMYYEADTQDTIREATTRILAEIALAKEGATRVGDETSSKDLRSDTLYARGWLPGHFGKVVQAVRSRVVRGSTPSASARRDGSQPQRRASMVAERVERSRTRSEQYLAALSQRRAAP